MATTQEIVDQLNEFDAETARMDRDDEPTDDRTPWDVILKLDEYDELATDGLNDHQASDRFVLTDGTVIRWDPETKSWYGRI